MGTVEVTVLLFASIADKAGVRRFTMPSQPGDTVARLRDRIVERFPQIAESLPTLLYAVDEQYVKEWEPVAPGSTLALIPPVSGG
jgi:molybdopterin converting factor subunit 1